MREDNPPTNTVVLCGSDDALATAALAICDAVDEGKDEEAELKFVILLSWSVCCLCVCSVRLSASSSRAIIEFSAFNGYMCGVGCSGRWEFCWSCCVCCC